VRGATGPLTSAFLDLSKRLGITEDATRAAGTTRLATKGKSPADGRDPWVQTGNIVAGRDVNFGLTPEQVGIVCARRAWRPATPERRPVERAHGGSGTHGVVTNIRIGGRRRVPARRNDGRTTKSQGR
jgi:hypothetical protein